MLAIKVYNKNHETEFLDLFPNVSLSLQRKLPAFDNDLQGEDFSYPIEIPFTDRNKKWLGFPENFNTLHTTLPEYWRCDVYSDNTPIMQDAKLKILSTKGMFSYQHGAYNFTISGTKGLFGSKIKNKKLTELKLGGNITWHPSFDSREFAKQFMDGAFDMYKERITFSPIYFADFFDTSRSDYLSEFIYNQIVNNIIVNPIYNNGWTFGRNNNVTPTIAIVKGADGYQDYRTIPFYKLFYLIRMIFQEHGFTVSGSFFDYPQLDTIPIFNNYALEKYDYPFANDLNTEIIPGNHMPDMLISEFLVAFQNFFNTKIKFLPGLRVSIDFKTDNLNIKSIKNFTNKISSSFESAERHESFNGGATLKFEFDSNDTYKNEKVLDYTKLNVIQSVFLFSDIASLTFSFSLDATHYIYVIAENYYYNYNPNTSNWDAVSEKLNNYEIGEKATQFSTKMSPLCQHYIIDNFTGFMTNQEICAVRMKGSYLNGAKEKVKHEFGLRVFYSGTYTGGAITGMPISFTHNHTPHGIKRAELSLSWLANDGLYAKLWKRWLDFLKTSIKVKTYANLNGLDLSQINEEDCIQIENNHFLIEKINPTYPINQPTSIELVKY